MRVVFEMVDSVVKRFSSKIIKMDENNQYGSAMTKPLPYGCIKLKKMSSKPRRIERSFSKHDIRG